MAKGGKKESLKQEQSSELQVESQPESKLESKQESKLEQAEEAPCKECKYLLHIKSSLEKELARVQEEQKGNEKKVEELSDMNYKLNEHLNTYNIDFNTFKQENTKLTIQVNELNNKIADLKRNYNSILTDKTELQTKLNEQEASLKEKYLKNNIVIPIATETENPSLYEPSGIRVPVKMTNSRSGIKLVNKRAGTLPVISREITRK